MHEIQFYRAVAFASPACVSACRRNDPCMRAPVSRDRFPLPVFIRPCAQELASSLLGGVASLSSVYSASGYFASYGNDLFADPIVAGANGWFINSGNPTGGSTWNVSFAPQSGFPGGYPYPVSTGEPNRLPCRREGGFCSGRTVCLCRQPAGSALPT